MTELERLSKRVEECCEKIASIDTLVAQTAKRVDNLVERVARHRRDLMSRVATLHQLVVDLIRQGRRPS